MFDDLTTAQLLNVCGHAYDAACLHYAKHDADYQNSLNLLLYVVDELMRRSREVRRARK